MADLILHEDEQRAILQSPRSIMLLMYWHDYQQTCADAMDMGCNGNLRRYEELKAHGRAIIEKEGADSFDEEVLRAFGIPIPESVLAARRPNATYPAGVKACGKCASPDLCAEHGCADKALPQGCTLPPPGWRCTRAAGHDGPCAAHPKAGADPRDLALEEAAQECEKLAQSTSPHRRMAGQDMARAIRKLKHAAGVDVPRGGEQ